MKKWLYETAEREDLERAIAARQPYALSDEAANDLFRILETHVPYRPRSLRSALRRAVPPLRRRRLPRA